MDVLRVAAKKYALRVLRELNANPNGLRWKTIAYDIVKNTSTADKLLKKLKEFGLVEKENKSPREVYYIITPQGEDTLKHSEAINKIHPTPSSSESRLL